MKSEVQENKIEKQDKVSKPQQKSFLDEYPQIKAISKDLSSHKNFDIGTFENIIKYFVENGINPKDITEHGKLFFGDILTNHYDLFDISNARIIFKEFIDNIKWAKVQNKKEKKEDKKNNIELILNKLNPIYQNVPQEFKLNVSSKEFQKFKTDNLFKIEDKLGSARKKGIDINTEEYLQYRFTAQKLVNSNDIIPNKFQFIQNFNQLNKLLDIDIQIPISENQLPEFPKSKTDSLHDFIDTPDKILELRNKSINSYLRNDEKIIEKFDDNIDEQNILKFYSEEIQDNIIKNMKKNKIPGEFKDYFDIETFTLKDGINVVNKEELNEISKFVREKYLEYGNKQLLQQTNTIIKQRIMTNCISGLASYFDVTNDNMENFAWDFKLDGKKDIDLKSNILHLQGMINGSLVGFYYDLQTGIFQMDDLIYKTSEGTYKIGKTKEGKINLPIKLPTIQSFKNKANEIKYEELFGKSENIEDYKKNLVKESNSELGSEFTHEALNQYYIHQANEKNMAIQENMNYMFKNRGIKINWEKNSEFNEQINPQQLQLLKIIDDTSTYYKKTGTYLQFRDLISQFNMLINSSKVKNGESQEPMINDFFNSAQMKESGKNRLNNCENVKLNYLDFFNMISKQISQNQIIDVDKLSDIVNKLEKDEKLTGLIADNYVKYKADENLEKRLQIV